MQVDAAANETRVNQVVLDQPEDTEKQDSPERQSRRMQRTDGGRHGREDERADQREEFEHSRQCAEHDRIRYTEYGEPDAAENADEDAGQKLRPRVGCERGVQLLEQPVPPQLAMVWQGSDERPP